MSRTFTKLFSSITESTVWCEPDRTRLVWICMLAMADQHGRVWGSIPGLANRARVPIEDARAAIECFLSPDADSRTKDFEGRRVEIIDGGWRLLNHEKYRAIRDEESIKESKRNYINARRAKEREAVEKSRTESNPVVAGRANAEAEAEAESKKEKRQKTPRAVAPVVVSLPAFIDPEVWSAYLDVRRAKRAGIKPSALLLIIKDLEVMVFGGYDANEVLKTSIKRGWAGVFEPKPERSDPMTFKERDAANAAERVREMTGGLVHAKPATRRNDALQEVFDAPKRLG